MKASTSLVLALSLIASSAHAAGATRGKGAKVTSTKVVRQGAKSKAGGKTSVAKRASGAAKLGRVGRGFGNGPLPDAPRAQQSFKAQHELGISSALLNLMAAPNNVGRQRMSQWCWAATSQMVLNNMGLRVAQEDIITHAYGAFIDRPATFAEMQMVLHGAISPDIHGTPRQILAQESRQLNPTNIVKDLAANRPPILGLKNADGEGGHAYVLTSIKYNKDSRGVDHPVSIRLRDPWPQNPSRIEISWREAQTRFIGLLHVDAI